MKRLFLMAISICIFQIAALADNDRAVTVERLPLKAQAFIKAYFPKAKVSYAVQESNFLNKDYKVIFTNGSKVEFDKKGEWTDVECKPKTVPTALIPAAIHQYVKQKYPQQIIVGIERQKGVYSIDLSNGLDLRFNKNLKLIEVDD